MSEKNAMSRRQFVAGASGLVLAGAAAGASEKTVSDPSAQAGDSRGREGRQVTCQRRAALGRNGTQAAR